MASSPVKFFSVFLAVSVVGWVVFTFAARLLAWFLSRVLSASVGFRVAGFNCLRDVTIKFNKGSVESLSIGEIKLSFRKSLVKLSFGFISKDPKLQLLINDLEIVTRSSSQNKRIRKSARPRSTGKGKWLVTSSMARLLSVSVTDLIIKVPKGAIDIKELTLDTLKVAGPNHILGVKLHLLPLNVYFGDLGLTADPMGSYNLLDAFQSDQASVSNSEKSLTPFVCEDLLVTCDFGHEKEKGIKIINLELKCGHVIANIDERLFHKKHPIPEYNTVSSNTGDATMDTSTINQTSKSKSVLPALKKQILTFPDKVSFSVPKLDVKFRHLHEGLSVDNNITGIQFTCAKSLPQDDLEEATPHFDVQIDLGEIHLFREGSSSLLEVLKVFAIATLDVPVDPFLPVRAEIDAKFGGTQCNVMLSSLMPWIRLHSLRTRGMKLSKRNSNQEISQKKDFKPILWTCTVAAPETAVMLYSINGLALYHACSQSSHLFANNIASKGIQIHTELGELLVHMEEEYREFLKENRFGVDTYSGSLMHIARVSLDWGYRGSDAQDMIETSRHALVLSIDTSDIEVKFGFKHLESLMHNLMSFRTLLKSLQPSGGSVKKMNLEHRDKKTKGVKILKLSLQKFSISYCGDANIVNMPVDDPKRVNYGSQGGQVIVSVSADGTPRRASITSVLPGSNRHLRFSASLVISHLSMCIDKERKTTEAKLERVKTIYEELPEDHSIGVRVTLLDMHIARVSLDWGYRGSDAQDMIETSRHALVLSIDTSDIEVKFGFKHLESLMHNLMSFRTLLKSLQPSGGSVKKMNLEHRDKKTKGVKILKLSLQKFSISYCGDANIVNMPVDDPKRVNYGSQGGQVIVSVSADGTPRRASITSVLPGSNRHLRFSASLVISHLSMCIDKERKTTEAKLERVKTIYEELPEDHSIGVRVTLLDMQNAKIVRRSSGHTEVAVCSLFSATDINLRWEPDAHLALYETFIRFKHLLHHNKFQNSEKLNNEVSNIKANEHGNMIAGSIKPQKSNRKGSIFVIDVDVLRVTAELADGVEANIHVQSIFTENAQIGVLSEGLSLAFNGSRVLKSTRIQISCIPFNNGNLLDAKVEPSSKRDWVVQGLDVHICMPYRLPLRAIEDAVEDMIRALKLVSSAKRSILCPDGKEKSKKVNSGASKVGSVKFVLRKLTADIEEEPIQGWLDEHYHLMRKKVCELGVRLKFLEEATSGSVETNDVNSERKAFYDGAEVGMHDSAGIQRLQEEIHKQTFRSYYAACQNLVPAEGSGACSEGFQAGFKPSSRRASLLSLSASELDVTLTRIDGGDIEMVEFIKGLDPVCQEQNIPFSRLYGSDVSVLAGSLVVQLRDYTSPLLSSLSAKCQGRIVLAQQATCFQPQIHQDVYIGRWQKVTMLRSASGTTPAMKMYSNLPIYFQKGEISFGVGYEPSFADISYAFQVALRRVNLSTRASCSGPAVQPPKKERSLPWWDDMRYYLHGKIVLYFNETKWKFLGTTNPYEHVEKLQIDSEYMEIQQTDGRVDVSAKEFKMYISSIENITKKCRLESITKDLRLKCPSGVPMPFIYAPLFSLNVVMDWQCESGNPLNHYLHALPVEGEPRKKVYDPFRSTYLSLRWNFSLRPLQSQCGNGPSSHFYGNNSMLHGTASGSSSKTANGDFPTMNLGAHDLAWVFKWWSLNYSPPHKLRSFSRWRRFGIPRAARSGNLSLDKVLVEFFFRVDATPCCIRHVTLRPDDPARGLTFKMSNLKYELCYSRGKQQYTFDCKRESLDLVYRGLDLHKPEVYLMRDSDLSSVENVSKARTNAHQSPGKFVHDRCNMGNFQEKHEDGFLLSSDYFTIRRQTRKADPERLMGWQDTGRSLEITYVRSEYEDDSESDHTLSEPSDDDDDFNVVLADNCQRVFVYGLKILWNLGNRAAVWSWAGGISKAFEPSKPSPSRQYALRKMIEKRNAEGSKLVQDASSSIHVGSTSVQPVDASGSSSPLHVKHDIFDDLDKGGTPQFMVNVYTPQFNLHSEEANGRFLLAAASGRVLARSFHSVVNVGKEMLEQALGTSSIQILELQPEMTWNKFELSVMLKDVQAHVAPTDVDPGAGLQWLPRILGSSEKLKRTGALLERVFMPCQMYFRYTRHKGGTADLRVKPLKELCFNSPDITATMTSRQFQVLFDVLRNLLSKPPKPRKSSLQYPSDDEDTEEETDEVVPDGVEEVELAKIILEQMDREMKLLLDDIRCLTGYGDNGTDYCYSLKKGDCSWIISSTKNSLVAELNKDFEKLKASRKDGSSKLREALQKAAQPHLMEKEKNKTPSCAMRISMKISKVVWSMLADGNTFAEAEINDMVYDFDRDYKDIGVARFTTKYFVVRNCMANAKCDTLLSAWNAPPGKINMLRVDAKQGAPKDGNSAFELFQVEIYPLRIYLSEAMYRMMWDYFFSEEDDSQRRQEVWRVSTSTGPRRTRRPSSGADAVTSSSYSVREHDLSGKSGAIVSTSTNVSSWQGLHGDNSQVSKFQSIKANMVCGSQQELRRPSSFERTWDESAAESVITNDAVSFVNSSTISSKGDPKNSLSENIFVGTDLRRSRTKDSKTAKSGRLSHEDKKVGKSNDEKKTRKSMEFHFHDIKISQVELLVTYEGSRLAINDLRLLMDTFHRPAFTGTWKRLFSRVKKHIIWGVLKSVTGMQGKKFSNHRDLLEGAVPENDLNLSDSDVDHRGRPDQLTASWLKRPGDGAGDGFVTSIRGLFNTQRRKAKAFVIRTMRGDGHNDEYHDEWSESDGEYPFARQLTITKAKKLIRKKFRPRVQKSSGLSLQDSLPSSPRETTPYQSDSSRSSYEDFHEQ